MATANLSAAQTTLADLMVAGIYGPYVFDANSRAWTVEPQDRAYIAAAQERTFSIAPQDRTVVIEASP